MVFGKYNEEEIRTILAKAVKDFCHYSGECPYKLEDNPHRLCKLDENGEDIEDYCPLSSFLDYVAKNKDSIFEFKRKQEREVS